MKRRSRYKIIDRGLIEFYRRAGEGGGADCVSSRRVYRCLLVRYSRGNATEEPFAVSAHLRGNFLSAPQTDGTTEGAVKFTHLFRCKYKTAALSPLPEPSSSGSFVLPARAHRIRYQTSSCGIERGRTGGGSFREGRTSSTNDIENRPAILTRVRSSTFHLGTDSLLA